MISANEKEFMMVAQFLADRMRSSEERLNNIALMQEGQNPAAPQDPAQETSALDQALEESPVQALPDVENFEELAALAREAGYTTSYRADDLLSEEELARLDAEYEQIEKDFAQATKLNKTDAGFITIAIALQVMRQVLQPKLKSAVTSAAAEGSPRAQLASIGHVSHSGPGPITGLLKNDKKKPEEADADGDAAKEQEYYAPLAEISDFAASAPYDAVTEEEDGSRILPSRKYRTLGSDPYFGYFFGTCNILTDTVTVMNRNSFKTKHVKDDEVGEDADFETALQSCVERYRESPNTVALAILKQVYRMAASKKKPKKKGFGTILLELLANTEVMNMLCATGLDFQHADVYKQAASLQWTFAEMINFIIAVTHRIAMAAEEYQAAGGEGITFDVIKQFHVFSKTERLCEARTRKILMISNAIASGINLAAVGSTAAVTATGVNMQLVKEIIDNLDVGGLAVTCVHLFTDTRFIAKIKKDYVAGIIRGDFEQDFGMVLEQGTAPEPVAAT